jgi:5'-nucleotidase
MNILLTNDDGYLSPGITCLRDTLQTRHKVLICAPMKQMSAVSHAITLFKPLKMIKTGNMSYAIDGTPADCIKVALFHFFSAVKIDVIISGINNGPNMGDDILYSGTVAGAREGSLNNIFSIAASLDGWGEKRDFTFPACFIGELLERLEGGIFNGNLLLNINFPDRSNPAGIRITHLGKRIYKDRVIFEENGDKEFVTITGEEPGFGHDTGSDLNAVYDGYISITPLANEVSDPRLKESLLYLESAPWSCFK